MRNIGEKGGGARQRLVRKVARKKLVRRNTVHTSK